MEIYWNGGDFNSPSSRVWDINNLPTHEFYAKRKSKEPIKDYLSGKYIEDIEDMLFESFSTFSKNYYDIAPPFDFVLLEQRGVYYLVSANDIIFDCKLYVERKFGE